MKMLYLVKIKYSFRCEIWQMSSREFICIVYKLYRVDLFEYI